MPMGQSVRELGAGSGRKQRWFVGLSLFVVVLVFFAMVGMVWCRSWWWRPVAPSSILVVEGSKEFEGTRIVIEGLSARISLRAEITEDKSFVCRFPLMSGDYDISVRYVDGMCWQERVRMEEYQYTWMSRAKLEECRKRLLGKPGAL